MLGNPDGPGFVKEILQDMPFLSGLSCMEILSGKSRTSLFLPPFTSQDKWRWQCLMDFMVSWPSIKNSPHLCSFVSPSVIFARLSNFPLVAPAMDREGR